MKLFGPNLCFCFVFFKKDKLNFLKVNKGIGLSGVHKKENNGFV